MDKAAARELAERYAAEVRTILDPDAIILFGSYVNGTPHEWSDIDIAIILSAVRHKGNLYTSYQRSGKSNRDKRVVDKQISEDPDLHMQYRTGYRATRRSWNHRRSVLHGKCQT